MWSRSRSQLNEEKRQTVRPVKKEKERQGVKIHFGENVFIFKLSGLWLLKVFWRSRGPSRTN